MKRGISIILCAAVLLTVLTACSGADDRLSVTTAKVKSMDALASADYSGVIHSQRTMAVIPAVSAKVVSVNVKIGQTVKAGDVLMQLDTSDAQLALKQAQAGLDTAKANEQKIGSAASKQAEQQARQALSAAQNELRDSTANYNMVKKQYDQNQLTASAQAAYDKAKSDYEKTKLMVSTGAASQNDLKNAQNALNSASAQLESAKAAAQNTLNAADTRRRNAQSALNTAQLNYTLTMQAINPNNEAAAKGSVDSAEVAVEIAQKRIDDSTVKAPMDGTVGAVNVKEGDLATPQSAAFQITNNAVMEVSVNVTESMVRKLSVGGKATVFLAATGVKTEGTVTEIASIASSESGMFPVKISIVNAQNLKDGMQASVHFSNTGSTGTVLVPTRSVVRREGKTYVFAVRSGKAVRVEVTLGETHGAYVEAKGLGSGDEVIVQGVNKAKDGVNLHIVSHTNG
ncbi:efflux RND transporter periplasmic adaptor subunit [Caproiciproducens galactitolivorans]|uniref:Putative efflux system component YknX n=1 Tax=Caproiciproducens galactitolivorans TaxID=642589 RepID=A0A4Z0YBA3_9FIRM|nr:efflux RND transporter periplasmic adaptor subunit [Caproiciproducens galactitolivorans]QEY35494.1 efflux RND transporter periplasmic adaptor subunit [Caproiciproducens galactitolivorans]TGJ77208.1 putative efflux system component YknX [Caproiciproducens galactitolivorans]